MRGFRRILPALVAIAIAGSGAASAQDSDVLRVTIETEVGSIEVELYPDKAPLTVQNFLRYVDEGAFAEGASFHRVVRDDNQPDDPVRIDVVQASPGQGVGPRLRPIPLERTTATGVQHLNGTISMARGGPDSATSSFFICVGDQPELDYGGARNPDGQGFAAFGRVVSGMEIVRAIHRAEAEGQALAPPIEIVGIERSPPSIVPGTRSPDAGGTVSQAGGAMSGPERAVVAVQERTEWHFAGVDFPPTIDSFVVLGVDRWPDPARGVVLHLGIELAPRVSVDVHVRPAPGGRLDDEALRADFAMALDEVRTSGGPSIQVSVDTVYATSVVAGGFTFLGHRAESTLRRATGTRRASLQVFPKAPAFIRIRAIYDQGAAPVLERRLGALVVEILEQVRVR